MKHDLSTLRLFNAKVDEIEQSSFIINYGDVSSKLEICYGDAEVEKSTCRYRLVDQAEIWPSNFSDDEVVSLVNVYRVLTEENDSASLVALDDVFGQSWVPEHAQQMFYDAKSRFEHYLSANSTVELDGFYICNRDLANLCINGCIDRVDDKKRQICQQWMQDPEQSKIFWDEFVIVLKELQKYYGFFKTLNNAVIKTINSSSSLI